MVPGCHPGCGGRRGTGSPGGTEGTATTGGISMWPSRPGDGILYVNPDNGNPGVV